MSLRGFPAQPAFAVGRARLAIQPLGASWGTRSAAVGTQNARRLFQIPVKPKQICHNMSGNPLRTQTKLSRMAGRREYIGSAAARAGGHRTTRYNGDGHIGATTSLVTKILFITVQTNSGSHRRASTVSIIPSIAKCNHRRTVSDGRRRRWQPTTPSSRRNRRRLNENATAAA